MPNRFGDAHIARNRGIIAAGHAGPFKRIGMAALFAGLFQFGTAQAQEDTPPTELLYQFRQPSSPGDSFSLRLAVPRGYRSAILICDQPGRSAGSGLPGSTINSDGPDDPMASVDWTRACLLLLPDSETGLVGLNGRLPEGKSPLELSRSVIQVRILLADRSTGDYLLSDPIPLDEVLTTTEQEHTETTYDVAAGSILSVADPARGAASEGPDGSSSDTEASSSFHSGTNTLSGQPFQPLPLMSGFGRGTFGFSSHDQPIPIQGSGH